MNLSTNRWHYYLASLLTPIGFIIFLGYIIIDIYDNPGFRITTIFALFLESIGLIAQILFLFQADRNRIKISSIETTYCILVFIIYCPIYFLSAYFFYLSIINKFL